MAAPPSPETAALYYTDAPARPDDTLYNRWLTIARAEYADLLATITDNERILAENGGKTPPELAGFCNLPNVIAALRGRARGDDAQTRMMLADPDSERHRAWMQRAVENWEAREQRFPRQ